MTAALILAVVLSTSTVTSTLAYLRLPTPTGAFAVGRAVALLTDPARPEPRSAADDQRQVRLITWYPAVPGLGRPTEYVPGYETIRTGLEASGEIGALAIAGLGLVKTNSRDGAAVAPSEPSYPVIILSPGNATNVAFYSSLAEDLASHGFVVIGLDHPYQVAAVDLAGGGVAVYPDDADIGSPGAEAEVVAKIDERVADIRFVLDRLTQDAAGLSMLSGRLDLGRVGIVGHSNGGVAAVESCTIDQRVDACMNIDGQLAGGPFSSRPDPVAPTKPFLYLTKEAQLHPVLDALFEESGTDTYRVVVPAANHDTFTDGPRFQTRPTPIDGVADAVLTIQRSVALAFFDRSLRNAPQSVFGKLTTPTDVLVEVFPLGDRNREREPLP